MKQVMMMMMMIMKFYIYLSIHLSVCLSYYGAEWYLWFAGRESHK